MSEENTVEDPVTFEEKTVKGSEEKVYAVSLRESLLTFILFTLLFGGMTLATGFFGGIYSAQYFFNSLDYEGDANAINTVMKYCNELSDSHHQKDVLYKRILERQDAELAYIDAFLKDKGAAMDPGVKRMARQLMKDRKAVGGEGPKKK